MSERIAAGLLAPSCPLPADDRERVTLAHGAGASADARLSRRCSGRGSPTRRSPRVTTARSSRRAARGSAFTTDGFVVAPLLFPGGDIGSLAVHGRLNDLAMCGARPIALSCALVLEEGLPLATLERVVDSIGAAARAAGVPVATGDTKVVERGKGDGVFVTTSGVGLVADGIALRPDRVRAGDAILVSGSIGATAPQCCRCATGSASSPS